MESAAERHSFSVDIPGLLVALTEQFPEPLLCVRELVQNAADAGAERIDVDVAYDKSRSLLRLSVRDDGRGMDAREIEGYLTIGFSLKDPGKDRGRFGVGKLSPYALGISRMVVETCAGHRTHRITFSEKGEGVIDELEAGPRGTTVRIYKACGRDDAEQIAERTFALVRERCGTLPIPLFVNGAPANRAASMPSPYTHRFESSAGGGVLGLTADPTYVLMGGGIVLETGAQILGPEVSYILDSPSLAPTLSRNAVRRDQAFDALVRAARAEMPAFLTRVTTVLRERTDRLRQEGLPIERGLDGNDRAAVDWLRSLLLDVEDSTPDAVVRAAPVLETADGGLVSADELIDVIRREGRVAISRVPRTRDEISAYADRGVPVLLLYRDLEDFLERQAAEVVEVDDADDGEEVAEVEWSAGEFALAVRDPLRARGRLRGGATVALGLLGILVTVLLIRAVPTASRPISSGHPSGSSGRLSGAEARQEFGSSDEGEFTNLPPEATKAPHAKAVPREARVATGSPSAPLTGSPTPPAKDSPTPATTGSPTALSKESPTPPVNLALRAISGIVALTSLAIGAGMLAIAFSRSRRRSGWLRAEAGVPLTLGESRRRRMNVLTRAILHPIDFLVARGWSARASAARSLGAPSVIKGYREFVPEPPIRSGVRLDLDRLRIGFVDLVSQSGDAHDGRFLVCRGDRVLLNRNHPTVRDLIGIAAMRPARARLLLDALLATDPELGRGTDPRQVEWDLLGRADVLLRSEAAPRRAGP